MGCGGGLARSTTCKLTGLITGCSQEAGPKERFVMGTRTQGVQEILEKNIYIGCPHLYKSELGDGTHGTGPFRAVLYSKSCAANLWHGHLTYL